MPTFSQGRQSGAPHPTMVFPDLVEATRVRMVEEIQRDVSLVRLYVSGRLTPHGAARYPSMLLDAARAGDPTTLEDALLARGVLAEFEARRGGSVRVAHNAAQILAEGEFNRFYVRGLSVRVLAEGRHDLQICRVRASRSPRERSERMLGTLVDAAQVLDDLRRNIGMETALGVPDGPGSGISVRLPTGS